MPEHEDGASGPFGDGNGAAVAQPVDDPRIYLAAERTFLAWMRTSVALMGFGFLIARFAIWVRQFALMQTGAPPIHRPSISPWLGFGMILVGVCVSALAGARHRGYVRDLRRGVANPPLAVGPALAVAAVLALVGLAMAVQVLSYSLY